MFSLLNVISGFLETGAVIFALRRFGIEAALLSALLYQAGNLVPYPVKISKSLTIGFSVVSGLFMAAGMIFPVCGVIAVPFFSVSVQSLRSGVKTASGRMLKRTLRIMGFLMGFCFEPAIGAVLAVAVLFCAKRSAPAHKTEMAFPTFGRLQVIMVLHQMHYFVYCYAIMIVAYQYGGALPAAALFFAGWITYVYAPTLYKNERNYRRMFVFGHSLLVAILLSMFFAPSLQVKALLWLLTGFGGTTEFCIDKLENEQNVYSELNHNCAENFGHILGVIACLASFVLTGNLYIPVLLSAAFASCAIILMRSLKRGAKT